LRLNNIGFVHAMAQTVDPDLLNARSVGMHKKIVRSLKEWRVSFVV